MFCALLKSSCRSPVALWMVVNLVALLLVAGEAQAHLELYHNVEVNFTETAKNGKVRFYFTIHAPELLVGFDKAGAEIFDASWLRNRSDEEFETLFKRARLFVKEKFSFKLDDGEIQDLTELLKFEDPAIIRDEHFESGVPVGCLLVTAEIQLKLGARSIEVGLDKGAGKRLLLVCNRKAAFPEVHDMDSGGKVVLKLPKKD